MRKFLTLTTVLLITLLHGTAQAAECSLNIERAYNVAVQNGWNFRCMGGVIDWSKRKKIGCRVRTSPIPGPTPLSVWARFFVNTSDQDATQTGKLKGGWRVKSFTVSGGQYNKIDPDNDTRLQFGFSPGSKANTIYKRHLEKLVVEHPIVNKSCKSVYNEAFK